MGHIANFPASLKHLDLSHNQVDSWFLESGADNLCYSENQEPISKKSSSSRMIPKMSKLSITSSNCSHKKHTRYVHSVKIMGFFPHDFFYQKYHEISTMIHTIHICMLEM